MDNNFLPAQTYAQIKAAERELLACNDYTARYGLTLSAGQAAELAERRSGALRDTGRVEFGGGVMGKLIYAFCDSPFISQENYAETLSELQDAFYYYKNESMDRLTDDELIEFMKSVFDGRAQGSLDYLTGTSLEELCRYAREDFDPDDADESGDLF